MENSHFSSFFVFIKSWIVSEKIELTIWDSEEAKGQVDGKFMRRKRKRK